MADHGFDNGSAFQLMFILQMDQPAISEAHKKDYALIYDCWERPLYVSWKGRWLERRDSFYIVESP